MNFASVGVEAMRTWLERKDEFSRFTDPLLAFKCLPVITPEVALMQASVAAEALGYAQAIQAGVGERKVGGESFHSRLKRLVDGQPLDIDSIATDTEHWLEAASNANNGIKHANRTLLSAPLRALIALTMTTVLRSQLLLELGVSGEAVAGLAKQQAWWGLRSAYASVSGWPTADVD